MESATGLLIDPLALSIILVVLITPIAAAIFIRSLRRTGQAIIVLFGVLILAVYCIRFINDARFELLQLGGSLGAIALIVLPLVPPLSRAANSKPKANRQPPPGAPPGGMGFAQGHSGPPAVDPGGYPGQIGPPGNPSGYPSGPMPGNQQWRGNGPGPY
ncbi:hypothetical protein [Actinoalloteichus hymeniacidonis]|uniref:hypothetical protein n=1 Tax=Actinoalloteichus hymeniacidonis TaxID=340345 RepID=UPI0012FC5968|nr:hypothetical protein [Actinoalloteichus hymeniacidonis]MBB5906153.1 hypothetical protein [Actinoalloteichus hymeniacidonis]